MEGEINDVRSISDFRGVTFSKYKKTDVLKELARSLANNKIEPCCFWSAELICAGHFQDLWEAIIKFYSSHVHLGNPKLAPYLVMRLDNFRAILNNGYADNLLGLRNNPKVRRLFAEIMCILCDARRKHSFDVVKIKKEDMNMLNIRERFKATTTQYAEEILSVEDPKELVLFINELGFSLTDANLIDACYWIEWILEYHSLCKIRREYITCERRAFVPVEVGLQKEIVWMIWELLIHYAARHSKLMEKIMQSLLSLFCVRYTTACLKKRRFLLYFGAALLCEPVSLTEELFQRSSRDKIEKVMNNVHLVYKQIKANEESSNTDYLFHDVHARNLESTIKKLEAMNTLGETFVPRVSPDSA